MLLGSCPCCRHLGQSGGRETDKASRCAGDVFPWDQPSCEVLCVPRSVSVVPDCTSYITLHMVSKQVGRDFHPKSSLDVTFWCIQPLTQIPNHPLRRNENPRDIAQGSVLLATWLVGCGPTIALQLPVYIHPLCCGFAVSGQSHFAYRRTGQGTLTVRSVCVSVSHTLVSDQPASLS